MLIKYRYTMYGEINALKTNKEADDVGFCAFCFELVSSSVDQNNNFVNFQSKKKITFNSWSL